jgi:hypothetical protein
LELVKLIWQNMVCSGCGTSISQLDLRTIEIATEIDFCCTSYKKTGCAYVNWADYIIE